jgi:succinate dehydrogenase flavin-adding protein (antitoxin of CptAB toxin-antitoxin module)
MKELDLLLERFARGELSVADPSRRRILARLLDLPDPVLVDYLLGQMIPPEPELAELVLRIRTFPPLTPAELAGTGEGRSAIIGQNGRPPVGPSGPTVLADRGRTALAAQEPPAGPRGGQPDGVPYGSRPTRQA